MTPSSPRVAIDCYVRASAAAEPVDEAIETLSTYDDEGFIDEFAVEAWPDEIRLTDYTEDSSVLDRYDRFRMWADDGGVSLEPAFERREQTTPVSDDSNTFLVFPVLCLAVRVDGELVSVAPHSTGTTTYTVADALADVESLPRVPPSGDVSEFPPDHPLRSAAASRPGEDSPTHGPDDEKVRER